MPNLDAPKGTRANPTKDNSPLGELEVVQVSVDDLNPNSYNPNRQTDRDFAMLRSSIRDDGFTQPVIVVRRNKEIVDGEHRWRAAIAEGMTEVPVVYVDMTPEQQRIATLRHNRARGSEDVNLAAELLRDLAGRGAADFAMESLQMGAEEMDMLLKDVKPPEVFDAPEVIAAKEADPNDGAAIADATRAAEKRIATENTANDNAAKAKDKDVFRVDLSYTIEEWDEVKLVLGERPADRLLALCKQELGIVEEPAAELVEATA